MNKRELGKQGEKIAEKYLRGHKINILYKNYYTRYGEIDIIGSDNNILIFFEVKLRTTAQFGDPAEAVTPQKWKRFLKAVTIFLAEKESFSDYDIRFDVLTLFKNKGLYRIEWLKNQNFD